MLSLVFRLLLTISMPISPFIHVIVTLLCVQYTGDPVSLAIAEAVLSVVQEEQLAAHAKDLGSHIMTQLQQMAHTYPCIGDVRYSSPFNFTLPMEVK